MKNYCVWLLLLATGAVVLFGHPARAVEMPPVVLNELMWMGSSAASSDEWIELRNTTGAPIDLTGWRLTKLSGGNEITMLTLPSGTIPAGGYVVISHFAAFASRLAAEPQFVSSSVSLVNSKLQVTLYDPSGVLIDRADDGSGSPLAGDYASGTVWKSMERNPSGADGTLKESWHTASESIGFDDVLKEYGTPGAISSNLPPTIVANIPTSGSVGEAVYFDGSESIDGEGDAFTLTWQFGDGETGEGLTPAHRFGSPGTYTVTVTASDGQAVAEFTGSIVISSVAVPTAPSLQQTKVTGSSAQAESGSSVPANYQTSKFLRINELLPNPVGNDAQGELIELINTGSTPVDLIGWKITNRTTDFRVVAHTVLPPKSVVVFPRSQTRIALKNSGRAELFLVDPFNRVIHGVAYHDAAEGRSFSRMDAGNWIWTDPTPGGQNALPITLAATNSSATNAADDVKMVGINDIAKLPLRTKVRVRGTITAAPGALGPTLFFLSDGTHGLQIFSSSGSFPDLAAGDVVEVQGTVGTSNGEAKINVRSEEDVISVGRTEPPSPVPFSSDLPSGTFTEVDGVIATKRSLRLGVETGAGTISVALPTSADLDTSNLTSGISIHLAGIWRVSKTGGRLSLRDENDLVVRGNVKGEATTAANQPEPAKTLPAKTPAVPAGFSPLVAYGIPVGILCAYGVGSWVKRRRKAGAGTNT